ncbi:BppU family phage baseplate upper protein [Bacillus nitratireducens]|uniref:BppU family phage baseplate upper protein n=1 Tax=Bacillus nitratireducens TaxID=2026193 RepID=UPI002E773618|nr:BppU family phage baseplate upper protein [Bacillus nitratireducens]
MSHSNIEFSQNNLNISELIFNITEDEKALPLNDTDKIIVYFKKPDKTVVFQDKEIEILDKAKGKIKVLLTTQTLVRAGEVNDEISIERVEEGTKKRASTYGFSFKVRSSIVSNDSIESTNEFQMFDELLELGKQDIPSIIASKEVAESALAKSTENTNQIGILSNNVSGVASQLADKTDKTYVDTKVSSLARGSPKGTYAT